ncbi:MAG: class II aldolase/adducin family protein [Lysobacterales bacterium]|jgi:ribulose-5-phosphate 4-epimerase/fuculose-1-phosphate aldolase
MNDNERRIQLAAAHRLALRLGLNDGLSNHFSVRLASDAERFYVTPVNLHWKEICASNLAVVRVPGAVVDGEGEVDPSALHIHSAILAARPDVECVLHTHQPYATAIAMLQRGRLLPASQVALRFHARIAYHERYNGAADNPEEARQLADALGSHTVLFHAHHGVVVAGPSVARAFDDLFFLERAARLQLLAQSTGQPLGRIPDEVAERYVSESRANSLDKQAVRRFAAHLRILDREEPGYAD